MRFGVAVVLAVLCGAFAAHFLLADRGYVLVNFRGYVVEMSVPGLVLVFMVAYLLVRALKKAWKDIDLTVEEGIKELDRICAMKLSVKGTGSCLRLPEPSPIARELLDALDVKLPPVLPKSPAKVDTKKKLTSQRKK